MDNIGVIAALAPASTQSLIQLKLRWSVWIIFVCGLIFETGLILLIALGNLTLQSGWYVGLFGMLFSLFGLACWLVLGKSSGFSSVLQAKQHKLLLPTILFFAVLFRLTALFIAPTLSTDQFRYTWEGKLVTLGISPYRYAPADPALIEYRSEIWPLVQQKTTASPYPPLSQLLAATEYWLFGESLFGPKIAAVLFDLLTCAALLWLLGLYRRDRILVILYAWSPLPILEFGGSGHNDAPMLFLLLVALGLAQKRQPTTSAFVLGLAGLTKFTALFGLPLFLVNWQSPKKADWKEKEKEWNWRAAFRPQNWRYPALTLATVIAGYVPFLLLGGGAIGSIFEYTGSWRDNDALAFQMVADWLGVLPAKIMSVAVLGAAVVLLSFHPRLTANLNLPRRLMLLFGITLMVASTVHSWYVPWLLVLLPLVYGTGFKWWDNVWLLFSWLVQFPYLSYAGDGAVYVWVKPLEYLPLYLIGGWSLLQLWTKKHPMLAKSRSIEGTIEGTIRKELES